MAGEQEDAKQNLCDIQRGRHLCLQLHSYNPNQENNVVTMSFIICNIAATLFACWAVLMPAHVTKMLLLKPALLFFR